ncbi:MAG: flavin reductase family protein [Clostridiales bacterium]|jgi:flavin reductase (DIM6/NTAB) family NADH-FMN oxidoreductase RutF|nr:flavin reductase family protein [Clostridiales bacterium]
MDYKRDLERALTHLTDKGAFLTVKSGDKTNTMTVSWGYVGFMWQKPYFIALVRPQRYTRKLLNDATSFTISVPYDSLVKELAVCGSKSGADFDKSQVVKFAPAKTVDGAVVEGCDRYYECAINYAQDLNADDLPGPIVASVYNGDYHKLFFGEIVDNY